MLSAFAVHQARHRAPPAHLPVARRVPRPRDRRGQRGPCSGKNLRVLSMVVPAFDEASIEKPHAPYVLDVALARGEHVVMGLEVYVTHGVEEGKRAQLTDLAGRGSKSTPRTCSSAPCRRKPSATPPATPLARHHQPLPAQGAAGTKAPANRPAHHPRQRERPNQHRFGRFRCAETAHWWAVLDLNQ